VIEINYAMIKQKSSIQNKFQNKNPKIKK